MMVDLGCVVWNDIDGSSWVYWLKFEMLRLLSCLVLIVWMLIGMFWIFWLCFCVVMMILFLYLLVWGVVVFGVGVVCVKVGVMMVDEVRRDVMII